MAGSTVVSSPLATWRRALKWQSYDATLKPLGRLLVSSSWSTSLRKEKAPKTEQPRSVPVHPVLAIILDQWKRKGWRVMMSATPTPDDLIVPSRRGVHRSRHHSLGKFRGDLDQVGLRRRRQHDLRRTFISLARADGARKDIIEHITHGQRGNIVDLYTEFPWVPLCEEVAKLKITIPSGPRLDWPGARAVYARRMKRA